MGDFTHMKLNREGEIAISTIERAFVELHETLKNIPSVCPREMALVRTNLQQASFWAKKAVAEEPSNQY